MIISEMFYYLFYYCFFFAFRTVNVKLNDGSLALLFMLIKIGKCNCFTNNKLFGKQAREAAMVCAFCISFYTVNLL